MVRTKLMRAQGSKAPRRQLVENMENSGPAAVEDAAQFAPNLNPAQIREQNIRENMKMLEELGLMESIADLQNSASAVAANSKKRQSEPNERPTKRLRYLQAVDENMGERRRSSRLSNMPAPKYVGMDEGDEAGGNRSINRRRMSHSSAAAGIRGEKTCTDKSEYRFPKPPPGRPHVVGAIDGIEVGFVFHSREEASYAGIHRGLVAGISGNDKQIYSICLNGGYEDDIDLGDRLCYTGAGGRDLKGTASKPKNCRTAPQSKDQTLTGTNLGLLKNLETKMPVRVLRGYKLHSRYAPEYGYRYDGLYEVVKHNVQMGQAGFLVQRFFLQRISGQSPLVERCENTDEAENDERNDDTEVDDLLDEDVEEGSKDD
uniref:YDG domain-containing protein n=1 Tax=Plectus sambesii TaxID=2011161 RepID=A0A914V122_9BILA